MGAQYITKVRINTLILKEIKIEWRKILAMSNAILSILHIECSRVVNPSKNQTLRGNMTLCWVSGSTSDRRFAASTVNVMKYASHGSPLISVDLLIHQTVSRTS